MQVVVDSLLTNYQKTGHGPKLILLLHGWADSLETFKELQVVLSKSYTVVSLDLPGFGKTEGPKNVWSLSNYATFVGDFLQKIKVGEPFGIIAHSNGGALAIKGLAGDILSTDKLILLASAGIRDRQKLKRTLIKVVAKTGKVATFWLPVDTKKKLQKKLYGVVGSDMLVAPHLQETFKRTVREDVQKDAAKLGVPTLLIYGEQDKSTPPLYGRIYHQLIDNSQLEILGQTGHFVHHDQAQHVGELIGDFLK